MSAVINIIDIDKCSHVPEVEWWQIKFFGSVFDSIDGWIGQTFSTHFWIMVFYNFFHARLLIVSCVFIKGDTQSGKVLAIGFNHFDFIRIAGTNGNPLI